jgi:PKD repeat protein
LSKRAISIVFGVAVLAMSPNALANNLMTNPGFESDFQGWTDWGNSYIETGSVHSGSQSLRVGPAAGGRAQRFNNLVAGTEYTMCAWSRADSAPMPSYVGVDIYDSSTTLIGNHQWTVAWTSWQQNSVTFTYPANGHFINVWVWTNASSSPTYVDDFILMEGASCDGAPTAGFSETVTGLSVDFSDTSSDDGTIVAWDWDFGDGNWSLEQNPSHIYSTDGVYTVSLMVTDDLGGTSTFTKDVAVGSATVPNVVMSWVPPYAISQSQAMAQADFGACDPLDGLSRVGLQFWTPNTNGTIKYADHEWYTPTDADVAWWTNWGQANGIEILLTIYNNDGSWNWPLARSAFADNRATFVNSLVSEIERLNLDGIDIDLEGIGSFDGDRSAFALFIQDLSAELKQRGKILTVDSFPYIWNAPNINWWSDWVGHVDNIQSMGYAELYEGGTGWQQYSWQQQMGVSAGHGANAVLMGMPAWDESHANWGVSSGRGTSAQAHVQEVRYDLPHGPTGIAIWDMQLRGWDYSDIWCEVAGLKGSSNERPIAGFGAVASELTVTFTDNSTDGNGTIEIWSWDFGDGSSSTAQNPVHSYGASGDYTVILTVTDDGGATDSVSQSVTVTGPNVAPSAEFSYASTDLTVSFIDASNDSDGSIVAWSWDFGDGNGSSAQDPSHIYVAADTYTVVLTVTDNDGAADSISHSVTVTAPAPQPPAAPSNLAADVVKTGKGRNKTITSVTLDWSDNSNNETGFEIERCLETVTGKGKNRTVTCDYTLYATVGADVTTLQVGTEIGYRYRVRAMNAVGASAYSNDVKV